MENTAVLIGVISSERFYRGHIVFLYALNAVKFNDVWFINQIIPEFFILLAAYKVPRERFSMLSAGSSLQFLAEMADVSFQFPDIFFHSPQTET